jgi:SAM-dependent MidA family methyltransferase
MAAPTRLAAPVMRIDFCDERVVDISGSFVGAKIKRSFVFARFRSNLAVILTDAAHPLSKSDLKTPLHANDLSELPIPDADALAHSHACVANIRAEIDRNNGWISFVQFMDLALYAPGLGYYAAGARKFGAAGDFVTAPEISSLFGECVARAIAPTIAATNGDVLELGPGSGKLACDVLLALEKLNQLPNRYLLLEVSADLRQRQTQALARLPEHLSQRAVWLDALPKSFEGAIIANEVLDVLPVHLLYFSEGQIHERGVASYAEDSFIWRDNLVLPPDLKAAASCIQTGFPDSVMPNNYLTEVAPAVSGLVKSLAESLQRGTILLIDYGFRQAEFYHESRSTGTLMCHYRHYAHTDPFLYPGLQDITAHVDFSDVAAAGFATGLELINYTSQAQFLLSAGITELLAQHDPNNAATFLPLTNQVQRLMSPAEMGEFFKVIGFAKGGCEMPALANARPMPL